MAIVLGKTLTIFHSGDVPITQNRPIIDHPLFQRMGERKQLGTANQTFRSATHTRFEHSIGTALLTKRRAALWVEWGLITPQVARDLEIYALIHDIGHGPYSHDVEAFCGEHNQRGLSLLQELRSVIEQARGDFEQVLRFYCGLDPVGLAVKHHPLGTDKLDYMVRDSKHIGMELAPPIDCFINYTSLVDGDLVVDLKIVTDVLSLQNMYSLLYTRIYLRKGPQIVQRFFQKMLAQLMASEIEQSPLTAENLGNLVDHQLMAHLYFANDPVVQEMYAHYQERIFPKVAITLRPQKFLKLERVVSRDNCSQPRTAVLAGPDHLFNEPSFRDHRTLAKIEGRISEMSGIPEGALYVVPLVETHRLVPKEVKIRLSSGEVVGLKDLYPETQIGQREKADAHATIRVCTDHQYRAQLADPALAKEVAEYIISILPG